MKMTTVIATNNYVMTGSNVLNLRLCKDIDVICYEKDILVSVTGDEYIKSAVVDGKKYEFLLADNQESLQWILEHKNELTPYEIAYICKYGHIHIAGKRHEKWRKHIQDYHFLKLLVDTEKPLVKEGMKLHRKTTNERVRQRTPRLKGVEKKDFFDDFVKKFIDHDLIHEEVAYDTVPAYTKMQKDATVECHKDLWDQMTFEEQCQCVSEETMVINIERNLLPYEMNKGDFKYKPCFLGYEHSLYRICTTLCSGWFRQFAIDNYFTILNMYDEDKLTRNLENILTLIQTENGVHS